MDERFWIHLLPWRQKNKAVSKSAQIKFARKLTINREEGWANLELLLANRSSWPKWVQEAAIALMDLNTKLQTAITTGKARHEILQHVGPNEALRVSIGKTVYDAAGSPQELSSCLVLTNVLYCVLNEWCNMQLDTCRVEMAGLTAINLHGAHWYDK